ncbi:MAG TPA: hypothetical protein VF071_05785 [Candidatus Limnocylindria bacterium]
MRSPPTVQVVLGQPSARHEEAIKWLIGAVGARTAFVGPSAAPSDGPCLHYGIEPTGEHDRCIGVVAAPSHRLWTDLLDHRLPPGAAHRRIDFDIVAATSALLDDSEAASVDPRLLDRHGRLRAADSYHGRAGHAGTAIVNRYVEVLADALLAAGLRDPLPRWPSGRRAAIGLSHDVDRPDKYAVLGAVARGGPRTWARHPDLVLRAGRDIVRWARDSDRDDFWVFEPLIASEQRLALRSTFLFASMPSHGGYGSRHDVHYDIGWPRFGPLFASMREAHVEIGLHASYEAYRWPDRFAAERRRLEDVAGVTVRGLRHHYWHLGPDVDRTLRAHEEAGFTYDSSIAFNDAPGLRRGVALPYRPWDPALARPLRVLQLPVLAMDSALFASAASGERAAERLWPFIEEVLRTGGLGVLDWHVRASYPHNREYRSWAECYQLTLERLATIPELWVTDLGSLERWWTEREELLSG